MGFFDDIAGRSPRRISSPRERRTRDASLRRTRLDRAARWGLLWLYIVVASGLPMPTLIVSAEGAGDANGSPCGRGLCGCSMNDRLLGDCCCAKKARPAPIAPRACCASRVVVAPSDCCRKSSDDAPTKDSTPRDDSAPAQERVALGFVIALEAAKCRGEDPGVGVFVWPHLLPASAPMVVVGSVDREPIANQLSIGRPADPPSPPPRLVAAL